ncbi:MAG: DUF4159 domain-containing protein [Opitutae bacterium]|nr:DUF4159 domain-containing protein [Opitutae bacterium]
MNKTAARCLLWLLLPLAAAPAAEPSPQGDQAIRCANLIYAGTETSRCFSDQFLSSMQQLTAIPTERRFKSVKLASDELFGFPFVVMTGEASFTLTAKERENLKKYLASGGFLLASAGCSSSDWDKAFRREIHRIFPDNELATLPKEHPVFHTVADIEKLKLTHEAPKAALVGLTLGDKTVLIYSRHGLNDTAHTEGCCCCGGNEIQNALQVNINILAYALLH